jgi:hypothetical protein
VHETRAGKTQRLVGQALEARAQGEVLALNLLHQHFSYGVLRGRKMPPIGTCFVCVIACDPKGCQQGTKLQKHRVFPGPNDVRQHSSRMMIERMPEPLLLSFGPHKTPHSRAPGAEWRAPERHRGSDPALPREEHWEELASAGPLMRPLCERQQPIPDNLVTAA